MENTLSEMQYSELYTIWLDLSNASEVAKHVEL